MKLVRAERMPIRFGFAHRFCQQVEPDPAGCMAGLGDTAGLGDKYFWNVGATLGGLMPARRKYVRPWRLRRSIVARAMSAPARQRLREGHSCGSEVSPAIRREPRLRGQEH